MGRTARKRRRKCENILKCSTKTDEKLYKKLKSWLISNDWRVNCNLKPCVFKNTGRGLMAVDEIQENQIILQIPRSIIITTHTVFTSLIGNLFSSELNYSAQSIIAIFLIYEKHLDHHSFWKPYLDTLPKTYTNPEFCTKVEKQFLYPSIANDLESMTKNLKFDYLILIRSIKLLSNNSTCVHCKKSFYNIFSYPNFVWAYYTVNTRAVYMDNSNIKSFINIRNKNNLALVPFLDFFNHDFETVAKANFVTISDTEKFYQIKSLKSYLPGTQVFINYGAHCNHKLFLEYGFFIPNNPLDQIFFTTFDIQNCHRVSSEALEFLKINNIDKSMAFTAKGLNYNAKNALFIVTSSSKFDKKSSSWREKIYCSEFDKNDLIVINQLGLALLEKIKIKLISCLKNMERINKKSESFSIAVDFVKEYAKLVESSLKYIKSSLN